MTVILIYAIYLFLILRFCMVLFNYISNPKLPSAPRNYFDFVSILVPRYDDLSQLGGLIQSIREQDFENYEVLIPAGDPEENAQRIITMFSGGSKRFRLISEEQLPGGSADKNTVCSYLAGQAGGDYLLFLNGVERVETGLIYNALYRMKIHSLGLLSLLTDQKMKTFGEGQIVPLVNYILFSLLPLRLILLSRSRYFAAASGQFMLFNARHYQTFQWHRDSKERYLDATAIMRKVKELGFRAETLLANGYVSGRMYAGFEQGIKNFGRNLISGFGGNVPALLVYLLLGGIGYLVILPVLSMQLLGMALALIIGMRIMTSLMSNQPVWWNLLFHPLQMVAMIMCFTASIFRIVRKIV